MFCFFSFLSFHFISSLVSIYLFFFLSEEIEETPSTFIFYSVQSGHSFLSFFFFFSSSCSLTINRKTKDKSTRIFNCRTNIFLIVHRSLPLNTLSFIKTISHFDRCHHHHFSSSLSTDHRRTTFEHMQRNLT